MVKLIKPIIVKTGLLKYDFILFFRDGNIYWGFHLDLLKDEPNKKFYKPAAEFGNLLFVDYMPSKLNAIDTIKIFGSPEFEKHYNYIKKHKKEIIRILNRY